MLSIGDLNANQTNPTIQYLVEGQPLDLDDEIFVNPTELDDTWEMAPVNVGQTHPGTTAGGGPGILDWILASPSAIVTDAEVVVFEIPPGDEDEFSDHYPVTAVLELSVSSGIGTIPDGTEVPGELLTVDRAPEDEITLSWDSSCIPGDVDYHVYGGTLGDFYTHTELACTTGGATKHRLTPGGGYAFYLVVPRNANFEGSFCLDGANSERPTSGNACMAQELDGCEGAPCASEEDL